MSTLYLTRGMMGSGKTTFAKEWVQEDPQNRVRVNRDDLRMLTFNQKTGLTHEQESYITLLSQSLVTTGLRLSKDVIVDDMHLRPKYVKEWYKLAYAERTPVELVEFPMDIHELFNRNEMRRMEDWVDPEVVKTVYDKFTKKGKFLPVPSFEEWRATVVETVKAPVEKAEPYDRNSKKKHAIIVDIDGTLALNTTGRGWFDWAKVGDDSPAEAIVDLINSMDLDDRAELIFMSGRDEVCRAETEDWLSHHMWQNYQLHMRAEGDQRDDTIVKRELFDNRVRDKYNVWFVLDDRPKVCRMWRDDLGLTVLQVGDPHVEF